MSQQSHSRRILRPRHRRCLILEPFCILYQFVKCVLMITCILLHQLQKKPPFSTLSMHCQQKILSSLILETPNVTLVHAAVWRPSTLSIFHFLQFLVQTRSTRNKPTLRAWNDIMKHTISCKRWKLTGLIPWSRFSMYLILTYILEDWF